MNDRWMNIGYEEDDKLKPQAEKVKPPLDQDRIGKVLLYLAECYTRTPSSRVCHLTNSAIHDPQ